MKKHDVIVIGSGTAGYTVANKCREDGLSVAVVERDLPGGTCALHGCQPKKFFVVQAGLAQTASHLVGKGVRAAPELVWEQTAAFKKEFTDAVPGNTEAFFARVGADFYRGSAAFVAPGGVRVADEQELQAPSIVLATGARPRVLPTPGAELALNSNDFLALPQLPKSLVFVGGGYISFEFAHIAAAYGAQVTILNRSARVLRQFDSELVDKVVAASRDNGIAVETEQDPVALERVGNEVRVACRSGESFTAEAVVVATGREANLDGMNLEALDLTPDARGLSVDAQMRVVGTTGLYAVGDCARTFALAPVADREALVAAQAIAGQDVAMDYGTVPSVCFSQPPIAAVGLTEESAQAAGVTFTVQRGETTKWPNQRRLGATHGAYKLLLDEHGVLLGAHLLGHEAGETINLFALAIRGGMPASVFKELVWAYPTLASDTKYMV